jgi:carbamoyltransferase
MNVLGISSFFHDSAAAIVVGDQVIAAAEEERFTREKHTGRFPKCAIDYCLTESGLDPNELDIIALFIDISPNSLQALRQGLRISRFWLSANPFFIRRLLACGFEKPTSLIRPSRAIGSSAIQLFRWAKTTRRELNLKYTNKPILVGVPHHLAHIGGSYLISGFDDAAILVADQRGEYITTTLATGRGCKIDIIKTLSLPDSLGSLYGSITAFLGFLMLSDEGKVMGLSSYGHPQYEHTFQRFLPITDDGLFKLDTTYLDFSLTAQTGSFPSLLIQELGSVRNPGTPIDARHADIAKSLQNHLEEALLSLCRYLARKEETSNLCMAGGIGLNSVANGRIARQMVDWNQVFVPPSPGDPGSALGAAVWVASQSNGDLKIKFPGPYLGPAFSNADCQKALESSLLHFIRCMYVVDIAAQLLEKGKVLAWFQGRMEFGPRALGNRSILADPRRGETKDKINLIKGRELWRPLAPSILSNRVNEWFVESGDSPYMSFVKTVRPEKADRIAACVHVDGTARLQTVSFETNPLYYRLLRRFEQLTGVPVLLNTSFNRAGEPIVCTPLDAVRTFSKMDLDYLIIGDFIAAKQAIDIAILSRPSGRSRAEGNV